MSVHPLSERKCFPDPLSLLRVTCSPSAHSCPQPKPPVDPIFSLWPRRYRSNLFPKVPQPNSPAPGKNCIIGPPPTLPVPSLGGCFSILSKPIWGTQHQEEPDLLHLRTSAKTVTILSSLPPQHLQDAVPDLCVWTLLSPPLRPPPTLDPLH